MRSFLALIFAGVASIASAQPPVFDGQSQQALTACSVVHKDGAAVNVAINLVTPSPPPGQRVYVCGIDLSVSNDGTGAVTQANVQFTSTNLNGWVYTYSATNAANTNGLDKVFYPPFAIKAAVPDLPVVITSPAANTHAWYSINLYYYFAP